ncbi:MAG: phage portal protein [Propylenella sp.]
MLNWLRENVAKSFAAGEAVPAGADSLEYEAKASKAGAIIALHTAGRPIWTPRTYAALARAGYMRNPVAYRSVRMVADAAASVPWLLYDGRAELDDNPLLSLLAKPNPHQAGREFLEALYGHLLVSGNAYAEAVVIEGAIRELYALRPDRMSVVPDANGWPAAFEYHANGKSVRFAQDGEGPVPPILHVREFHPLDDYYGFPPLEAAQMSLDVHNAASAWNKALLDNAARPSGALVYKGENGSNLSEEQFERLRDELVANFSGATNAGRPLLLEGGLTWQSMSLSPKDMDFLELKHGAAREIALAFGVPPMLLGIPGDNTYANFREANLAFWRQTVLPLAGRFASAFGAWLGPAWGEGLRLGVDADQVEALAAEREALWRRVNEADFLTPDEKREAVGYGAK